MYFSFKALVMPEHDLDELEENFWCHKHDHNDENHKHENNKTPPQSSSLRKSILHNNTTLILNTNHINPSSIQTQSLQIQCSNCQTNLGYTKTSQENLNYHFWKSNLLIDNQLKFNLISFLTQGRYIIQTDREKTLLFIHLLPSSLYVGKNNQNILKLETKKFKKLLYKLIISENETDLKRQWYNDINVEIIKISRDYYLKFINCLIESTKKNLCKNYRMSDKNEFLIAII